MYILILRNDNADIDFLGHILQHRSAFRVLALVLDIPTGGTHIPSYMRTGIHKTKRYSYHCDTG